MNKKKVTLYGAVLSVLCIVLAITLPFHYSIYLSQFYTVASVTLYMITMNNAIVNLSIHLHKKHPKLMQENSIQHGKNKGLRLLPFKVFKNRATFKAKNDPIINLYMELVFRCFTLILCIFPMMIVISMLRIWA